jgi:UDP-glucose:(glucosyl)LPS alpha-1,2-glucosyltransferase
MDDSMLNTNGTVKNSKGGTEYIANYLENNLPTFVGPKFDEFKIIHSRVRDFMFEEGKKHILVCHDMFNDPENEHLKHRLSRQRFEKIVFVSNWQKTTFQMAYQIADEECCVIRNAIVPFEPFEKQQSDTINLIYHTTPHRGLEILIPVFEALSKEFDNLHLDVFSSFSIYGWGQRDEQYKQLFDICDQLPNVTNHGAVDNDVVRDYLKRADIFAYPSIWPETSCIAAIEAGAAGCHLVTPEYGALPETTGGFALSFDYYNDKQKYAQQFYDRMRVLLYCLHDNRAALRNLLVSQQYTFNTMYAWDYRIMQWCDLLNSL